MAPSHSHKQSSARRTMTMRPKARSQHKTAQVLNALVVRPKAMQEQVKLVRREDAARSDARPAQKPAMKVIKISQGPHMSRRERPRAAKTEYVYHLLSEQEIYEWGMASDTENEATDSDEEDVDDEVHVFASDDDVGNEDVDMEQKVAQGMKGSEGANTVINMHTETDPDILHLHDLDRTDVVVDASFTEERFRDPTNTWLQKNLLEVVAIQAAFAAARHECDWLDHAHINPKSPWMCRSLPEASHSWTSCSFRCRYVIEVPVKNDIDALNREAFFSMEGYAHDHDYEGLWQIVAAQRSRHQAKVWRLVVIRVD